MSYKLNPNVVRSISAPIPQVAEWLSLYQATPERPLLNLAPGHPRHMPPESLVEHTSGKALSREASAYGLGEGDLKLRRALATDMQRIYADVDQDEVVEPNTEIAITAGANQALYLALQCVAAAGDQVILTVPWFFNNAMALDQLGIETVLLKCKAEDAFVPSPAELEKCITAKTRAVILVSPANPTGTTIPPEILVQFAQTCHTHKIALILDETYRDLLPNRPEFVEEQPHTLFGNGTRNLLGARWDDYLIHVYSFSKSYSVPGYRLGALVASSRLITQALKIIDTQTICPSQIAQAGVARAISETLPWRRRIRDALNYRMDLFCDGIRSLEHLGWRVGSSGGFYAFVKHPFDNGDSVTVVKAMIAQCGVVALPGAYFCPVDTGDPEIETIANQWLRFSIPNLDEYQIRLIPDRLRLLKRPTA